MSTFTWDGWQYYETPTGIKKKRNFIVGRGWQKSIRVTKEEFEENCKKHYSMFRK